MNLPLIIAHMRQRVPVFSGRVAGAARFEILPEVDNLLVPAAYVIPTDEEPLEQDSQNGYRQQVREGFAVVVAVSNETDERGQQAATDLHAIRAARFLALLGFQPAEDYGAIQFEGGQLLHLDRKRMYYQYSFSAGFELDTSDTWIDVRDSELPDFEGVDMTVDAIDPFDPNTPAIDFPGDPTAYPGGKGPDGRAETGAIINLNQEP
jgi:hypothetical protein